MNGPAERPVVVVFSPTRNDQGEVEWRADCEDASFAISGADVEGTINEIVRPTLQKVEDQVKAGSRPYEILDWEIRYQDPPMDFAEACVLTVHKKGGDTVYRFPPDRWWNIVKAFEGAQFRLEGRTVMWAADRDWLRAIVAKTPIVFTEAPERQETEQLQLVYDIGVFVGAILGAELPDLSDGAESGDKVVVTLYRVQC